MFAILTLHLVSIQNEVGIIIYIIVIHNGGSVSFSVVFYWLTWKIVNFLQRKYHFITPQTYKVCGSQSWWEENYNIRKGIPLMNFIVEIILKLFTSKRLSKRRHNRNYWLRYTWMTWKYGVYLQAFRQLNKQTMSKDHAF